WRRMRSPIALTASVLSFRGAHSYQARPASSPGRSGVVSVHQAIVAMTTTIRPTKARRNRRLHALGRDCGNDHPLVSGLLVSMNGYRASVEPCKNHSQVTSDGFHKLIGGREMNFLVRALT